jgi:predicted DNA-binding transcriptional regulator YafY
MADSRKRLLMLREYLFERTDEKHAATAQEMIAHLELAGVPADRRTVYADLALLKRSGMDIRVRRRRANEYYLASRVFERMELRILADMVRASRALSRERSEELIEKLGALTSQNEAALLFRPYGGGNPHKVENERAYLNAGRILCALEKGGKLSFVPCAFTAKKAICPRRGTEAIVVNPYLLVYAEDNYYLIADHPAREGFAHYRLDQMSDVRALDEAAVPVDPSFDAAVYARSVFSMAPAEQRWVRLVFDRQLIGSMVDRFGADVPIEQMDDLTCALRAPVRVSPPFYGWVFQFGGGVRILEPDDVRERMLLMLEAARKTEQNR